jgi:hypothetical protein
VTRQPVGHDRVYRVGRPDIRLNQALCRATVRNGPRVVARGRKVVMAAGTTHVDEPVIVADSRRVIGEILA